MEIMEYLRKLYGIKKYEDQREIPEGMEEFCPCEEWCTFRRGEDFRPSGHAESTFARHSYARRPNHCPFCQAELVFRTKEFMKTYFEGCRLIVDYDDNGVDNLSTDVWGGAGPDCHSRPTKVGTL